MSIILFTAGWFHDPWRVSSKHCFQNNSGITLASNATELKLTHILNQTLKRVFIYALSLTLSILICEVDHL